MTVTTEDYWEIGGVALNTFAHNIETMSGRDTPPRYRGSDIVIPYAVGERWVPKIPGPRILPLKMWVRGVNSDGTIPVNQKNAYDDNWRSLRNMLWNPGKQFLLTKHFKVGGVAKSATALAEFYDGLEPTMIGRKASKFYVELKLANPYFYDDLPVSINPLSNGNNNVVVPGDTITDRITITISDARSNPTLINNSLDNPVTIQYQDDTITGDVVSIEVAKFLATYDPTGAPLPRRVSGKVVHAGAPQWFLMKPGTNVVNLSSSSGSGAVGISVRGAWL